MERCPECGHEPGDGRFCGWCGARSAVAASSGEVGRGASSGSLRVWIALGSVAAVVGVLVATAGGVDLGTAGGPGDVQLPTEAAGTAPGRSPSPSPTEEVDRSGAPLPTVFEGETGTVLLFERDPTGAAALALDVDADARRVIRLPGAGGEELRPLFETGGAVIVGWGSVLAVRPGSTAPVQYLGDADYAVPDVVAGQVWLVDQAEEATGEPTTATLVTTTSEMLHEVELPDGLRVVRGVPGGLAVRDRDNRVHLYDPAEGGLEDSFLGRGVARIGDADDEVVVWCGLDCDRLFVTAASGTRTHAPEELVELSPDAMWLSADGSRLALLARVRVTGGVDFELRILDVESLSTIAQRRIPLAHHYGDWAPRGEQFFYWIRDPNAAQSDAPRLLGRWTQAQGFEEVNFAPGDAPLGPFVALDADDAEGLFPTDWSLPRSPLPAGWELYVEERLSLHHPRGWQVDTRQLASPGTFPLDLLTVASADLTDADPTANNSDPCTSSHLGVIADAIPADGVALTILSPTYAQNAAPAPLIGAVTVTPGELDAALAETSETGGLCGATVMSLVGRVGEWIYDAWLIVGAETQQADVDDAVAVFNSFRPVLGGDPDNVVDGQTYMEHGAPQVTNPGHLQR